MAPDGSLAVFGDGGDSDDGSVLVADLRRLRRVGTVRLGWPWQSPFAASWLGRSRVLLAGVGVTDGPEGDQAAAMVSVVDLAEGRVVARRRVVGELLVAGRLPDGLVLLLFERRNQADYSPVTVAAEEAEAAIRDAERVVGAVEAWLAHRAMVSPVKSACSTPFNRRHSGIRLAWATEPNRWRLARV